MKTLRNIIVVLMLSVSVPGQSTIMSYNLRYNNPNDGDNWWRFRKSEIVDMIKTYHPDILGIQEGLNDQVEFLDSSLVNYDFCGVGRDDGRKSGEYSAIFYDTTIYKLFETKTFWLSPTPDKVSVGWDASMERICTYGKFLNKKTNENIHVFNCHFDHVGKKSRRKSAKLILKQIKQNEISNEKIVVMGDLNCEPDSRPIRLLKSVLNDSGKTFKRQPSDMDGTYNGFDIDMQPQKRIDYIFVKNQIVTLYKTINDKRKNGLWLSDHLPLIIEIE